VTHKPNRLDSASEVGIAIPTLRGADLVVQGTALDVLLLDPVAPVEAGGHRQFLGRRKGCDAKTYQGQKDLDRIANFRSVVVDNDNATLHLVVEDGRSF
jgi:hypothetical protein